MIVQFTIFEKRNPMTSNANANRYTNAKSTGDVTFKSLRPEISKQCTTMRADTLAIMAGLLYESSFPPWAFTHVYGHIGPTGRGGQIFLYKASIIRD